MSNEDGVVKRLIERKAKLGDLIMAADEESATRLSVALRQDERLQSKYNEGLRAQEKRQKRRETEAGRERVEMDRASEMRRKRSKREWEGRADKGIRRVQVPSLSRPPSRPCSHDLHRHPPLLS